MPAGDDIATTLANCGEGLVLAKIIYQKPGEEWITERLIEPYQFTHSPSAVMVQAWQVEPVLEDPAWRTFRLDRINSATATTEGFRPRQPVTIFTGESTEFVFGKGLHSSGKSRATPMQLYTQRLHEALVDLDISSEEMAELRELSKGLTPDRIRASHGRFYGEMLAEVCADGRVTKAEIDKLTALRVWLGELGWSP